MSNDPHTTLEITDAHRIAGVGMDLTHNDEPIRTAAEAVALAEAFGFAILPRHPENGDGRWVCDLAWGPFLTLVESGWLGLENGPFSAEAEWE